MEILDLAKKFENIQKAFTIVTGIEEDNSTYGLKKQEIVSSLDAIKKEVEKARNILQVKKERLQNDKILLEKILETKKYIEYVDSNMPLDYINSKVSKDEMIEEPSFLKTDIRLQVTSNDDVSPCPSNWSTILATPSVNASSPIPVLQNKKPTATTIAIPYVTSTELNTVPNYMRGRITISAINLCIDSFNTTLNKKYAIMRQKRKDLKTKDLDMYTTWKTQDDIKKDKCYCTPEDLINLSGFKMEKSAYNIITILRHLKRIQEVKIKGMKSRYIIN